MEGEQREVDLRSPIAKTKITAGGGVGAPVRTNSKNAQVCGNGPFSPRPAIGKCKQTLKLLASAWGYWKP